MIDAKSESEVKVLVAQLCPSLCEPMACSPPPSPIFLSMGFSRQEYWNGLPFPSPGGLLEPGIEPGSTHITGRFFTIQVSR